MIAALLLTLAGALPLTSGHIAFFHPSMYGFNVTQTDPAFPGVDNSPMAPLMNMNFSQWWFHGHLGFPPNAGDLFELPAGKPATAELACNKGLTSFFASSPGGDVQAGDNPCTASDGSFPSGAMHTNGFDDLKGCALAIAYESDVTKIQPENFTVFSVNQTCVWNRFTDFEVPERMPPCPEGGCHCAWFWIHSPDSGGEQNYMNGFKCNVTGSSSNVAIAEPQLPRRCGADPDNGKPDASPGNCTYGAKQPFYWFQQERNNMFEGTYSPPFYTDLYNFKDGAQNDIFVDSYPQGLPPPSPNSTFVPTPFLGNSNLTGAGGSSSTYSSVSGSTAPSSTLAGSAAISSSASILSSATSALLSTTSAFSSSSASQPDLPVATNSASSTTSSSSIPPPDLPLSSNTVPISTFSATSVTAGAPESASVIVSTSIVLSTVLVTVTAAPPPVSTSAVTQSTGPASSSSIASSLSSTISDLGGVSTAVVSSVSSTFMVTQVPPTNTDAQSTVAASTIVLNLPTSSATSTASPVDTGILVASTDSTQGAEWTNTHSENAQNLSVTSPRVGLLAADTNSAGALCKRQSGRKVFRRRVPTRSPPALMRREHEQKPSLLSRISIPGLRRHRRLQNRSGLWNFF